MIDYSVYMLANPVKKDEPKKAYAKNQISEVWTLEKFAKHIADHNGVYSRGTVKGVISDMCECLVEQILNGNKVLLGELGSFAASISSEGAASLGEFTAKNIKAVNIIFTPGTDFENLINEAEFNLVSSRVAQAATLKAEKAGENTVDLAAAKKATEGDKTTDGGKDAGTDTGSGSGNTGSGDAGSSEEGNTPSEGDNE